MTKDMDMASCTVIVYMKNMMKYTKVSGIKTNKQGQGTLLQIDSNNNRKIMYEGQWFKDKKHGQGKGI